MGCNTSKLDDEEAVQLCKDRKKFIKQALEQQMRFATSHVAYIQSLKRVCFSLKDYFDGDEPREFLLDSFVTPVKKTSPKFITISPKCLSAPQITSDTHSSLKINYYRSGGNPPVSVEERPDSPQTVHVQSYSPVDHYGIDGFFTMQSPERNSSFYSYSSYNRPNYIPPPSPQNSQWDFFWNPFSSLDYYGYPTRSNVDQSVIDDENAGLRQVREEEGIPDLEEETEHEDIDVGPQRGGERARVDLNDTTREEVTIEDVNEDEEDDDDDDDDGETEGGDEAECDVNRVNSHDDRNTDLSRVSNTRQVEVNRQKTAVVAPESKEEGTPGFTVYVNRRPTSMQEVIKDLETQFTIICNVANEVSSMLEASRARYRSTSTELSAMKMLNPVALFRSASSRSSSSRFVGNSSSSRDEGDESSSSFSEDSCMFSGSHHSTLDRLYTWEKRLYEEVRSGEKVRRAYEKKCTQLRNQDVKGEDPSSVDKTRQAIQEFHTRIKVSIHSIESISKRIEILRDEELHPQLLEMVQGLGRMWKVMAESHQIQKRTLDEAKILLASTPSKLNGTKSYSTTTFLPTTDPQRLARSASNLETELRNWKSSFESWIASQRSYVTALTSWLLRCIRADPDTSKLPFSPRRSAGVHPVYGICIQWSRFLDMVTEVPVLDGMDFFAAGMGSVYLQQSRVQSASNGSNGSGGGMEVVEFGEVEEVMTSEKLAELGVRVLCAGMSVAVSSLAEFAVSSADGYGELVNKWENATWPPPRSCPETG